MQESSPTSWKINVWNIQQLQSAFKMNTCFKKKKKEDNIYSKEDICCVDEQLILKPSGVCQQNSLRPTDVIFQSLWSCLKGIDLSQKNKNIHHKKNRRQQHMLTFSEMKADTVWYFCSMKHLQSKNTRRRSIFMPSLLSLLTTSDTWTPRNRRWPSSPQTCTETHRKIFERLFVQLSVLWWHQTESL